jgi:hypothetical protein
MRDEFLAFAGVILEFGLTDLTEFELIELEVLLHYYEYVDELGRLMC